MFDIYPPHEPNDDQKIDSLVEDFKAGKTITPIVAYGVQAYSGSHRIAAFNIAYDFWVEGDTFGEPEGWNIEPKLEVLQISDETYKKACCDADVEDLEQAGDFNDICDYISSATDDVYIISALEDQIS